MDLSILIVNWNTRSLLAQCLDSVQRDLGEFHLAAETWVIDNASGDGSVRMLLEEYPWVHTIQNDLNLGFAAANNQGVERSAGKFILLLNSDTIIIPGALKSILDFMRTNPEAGAAGARLLHEDGSLQVSCFPEPTLLREVWRLFHLDSLRPYGVYDMAAWHPHTPRQADNVLGACMLLRRETIEQVGLMDESYFMYSEEIDWCLRIRRAGWKIYWVPQAEVVHLVGQSTRRLPVRMFLFLYRGKIRYFRKHHGRLTASLYKIVLLAASLARLAASPLLFLQAPSTRKQKLNRVGYYARLLRHLPGY